MNMTRIITVSFFMAMLLLIPVPGRAAGDTHLPIPFSADYDVDFGAANGLMELELKPAEAAGVFEYVSNTRAKGFARMFFKGEVNGSTQFRIADDRVQPLLYHVVDNKGRTQERILFDWSNGIADSEFENTPSELAIEPGVLDVLSVDLTVIRMLNQSESPATATYIDENEIKIYEYTLVGDQSVDTKAGSFDCVMYKRQRQGSRRFYNICYAPVLSHLPVMIEQYRYDRKKDENELKARMTLRTIDCEGCASPDGQ